jgi:capsular exopolysaccharide synthesis family protein
MNLNEIFSVLWHQKLVVLVTMAVFVGAAIGSLEWVKPRYRSTATLALSPKSQNLTNLVFFQTIDSIVPIYATAATTDETEAIARETLGGDLADISVRTFSGAPIFKIDAESSKRSLAQDSAQSVTAALKSRVESGNVGVQSLRLQEIDRPSFPKSPVFPRRKLTIAIASLLGFAFGVGFAFLRESLSNKVRTRQDLAEAAGVPVYAEVPLESALGRRVSSGVLLSYPGLHGVTEALRDLRTNLLFSLGTVRSVAITGPEGRHGKTTVALGLAVTMARSGARTLLIDADLRRGRLADALGLEREPGLYEVLSGKIAESAIQATSLRGLDVMTSGRLLSDPGELLAAEFPRLLRQLEGEYDTIVIDTTPLVPVGDARIVASVATSTVLVASAGTASKTSIRQAVERLALISVTPTGAVLNKSRSRQARGYYGHSDADEAAGDEVADDKISERV